MSLLLDALKKAEAAKRRRQAEAAGEAPPVGSGESVPAAAPEAALPTLSLSEAIEPPLAVAPASITEPEPLLAPALAMEPVQEPVVAAAPLSFELAEPAPASQPVSLPTPVDPPADADPTPVAASARTAVPPVASTAPEVDPTPQPSLAPLNSGPAKLSPAAARQLFDSKQSSRNDAKHRRQRLAVLVGIGVVGLLLAGGWLWWQLRSPESSSLTLVNATPPGDIAPPPAPAEILPPAAPPVPAADPASARPVAASAAPASRPATPRPPVEPQPGDRAKVVEVPANVAAGDVHFVRSSAEPSVPRNISQAYQAFEQGDYARAAELYRQQLAMDGKSRDALLGLAAVAVKRQQLDEARGLYRRLLADNPKDELAASALASLSTDSDADGAEGRLKALLASNPRPETAAALGNLLAKQGRWREAQDYYFQAHSGAPADADFAFNLAVALDALGEGRLAAGYYDKALKLAGGKPAGFDQDSARRRLAKLGAN